MAKDENKRLSPGDLSSDNDSFDGLKTITDYKPVRDEFSFANVQTSHDAMMAAQTTETQAEKAFKKARDLAVAAEWNFHNTMLGVKDQVIAQYGNDSNEIQAVGLKKTSEYKKPKAKVAKATK